MTLAALLAAVRAKAQRLPQLPHSPFVEIAITTLIALGGIPGPEGTEGRPQFEPLRRRLVMRNPKSVAHAAKVTPAAVFAFDLLALRGKDMRAMPLTARKILLKDVLKDSTRIRYTQHVGENGVRLFQAAAVSVGDELRDHSGHAYD